MPVLSAGAQVVTGEIDVQVRVLGSVQPPKTEFAFQVNGGAETPFTAIGINAVTGLDVSQTYNITPVDHAGFTATIDDSPPDITCTNVTIDPAAPTPPFCRLTFTFIEPTTTTTTTTTTQPPPTTKPPATTIFGSHADANRCTVHLNPNIQPDAPIRIGVTLATNAGPQPHFGAPIALTNTKLGLAIPAGLLQQGVDLDLIKGGDQVPSTVTTVVTGSNTTQGAHTYVVHTTATIQTVNVPVSAKFPKGKKALPLNATLSLPDTSWTPTSGTADVAFAEKSMRIVSSLTLPGIGPVTVTFTCSPDTTASFVAVGATGVATTTTPETVPGPGGGAGGGDTTGGLAGGAQELPRTGSSPWPLVVVAAGCIDLGMLAIAGAKRRRRPLHH
jgi:hypothetical protein